MDSLKARAEALIRVSSDCMLLGDDDEVTIKFI